MPFKVKVESDINVNNLGLSEIKEIIGSLENAYKNIRADLYSYFLGKKSLQLAGFFITLNALFYLASQNIFYVYLMFFTTLSIMALSIFIAEAATKLTQKQVRIKIDSLKKRLESLKQKEMKQN